MKDIIKMIKSGELTRDNDEHGTGGFWDYAWDEMGLKKDEEKENVYNALWEVVEEWAGKNSVIHPKNE